jgi:hypothetical protein
MNAARIRSQRRRVVMVELAPRLFRAMGGGDRGRFTLFPGGPDFIQPNPPK